MGDSLGVGAGIKYYPMRELGFDDIGELLNISAANANLLSAVRAWSGKDPDSGAQVIIWNAAFNDTSVAIDLTVYGNMDIGSMLFIKDSGTYRLAYKAAKSTTAVVGDWYYVNLTVVS
jgi:hypothetical protein